MVRGLLSPSGPMVSSVDGYSHVAIAGPVQYVQGIINLAIPTFSK